MSTPPRCCHPSCARRRLSRGTVAGVNRRVALGRPCPATAGAARIRSLVAHRGTFNRIANRLTDEAD